MLSFQCIHFSVSGLLMGLVLLVGLMLVKFIEGGAHRILIIYSYKHSYTFIKIC
jgi:hypothetical protein